MDLFEEDLKKDGVLLMDSLVLGLKGIVKQYGRQYLKLKFRIFLMISGFSLILVNNYFTMLALFHNSCRYACTLYIASNLMLAKTLSVQLYLCW